MRVLRTPVSRATHIIHIHTYIHIHTDIQQVLTFKMNLKVTLALASVCVRCTHFLYSFVALSLSFAFSLSLSLSLSLSSFFILLWYILLYPGLSFLMARIKVNFDSAIDTRLLPFLLFTSHPRLPADLYRWSVYTRRRTVA